MTSAFIIEVNSQLQPDPNEETAALLRVLIHKMDNTTFGNNAPTVPQWTGPPRKIVHVQAILFASLATSLFSAFLAMLGKQWLNRYASVDIRGSAIERGQNRQRKLNGIVTWYFDHVMQLLPLMLQAALLLLGCALSRYLWEVDITVASVVVGVTSFGVLFYLFIAVVGAVFVSCPYQTPGAQMLRRIPDAVSRIPEIIHCFRRIIRRIPDGFHRTLCIPGTLRPVLSASVEGSFCCSFLSRAWELKSASRSPADTTIILLSIFLLPVWLIVDACKAASWPLITFSRRVYSWSQEGLELQATVSDPHCISWTLRTSLDGPVRLSTLNYLARTTPTNSNPALFVDCFDILIGCVKVVNDRAVATQGMEQLAKATILCCLHTLSFLAITDPTRRGLKIARQRYVRAFPFSTSFDGLPSSHILRPIHRIFYTGHHFTCWQTPRWEDYKPSSDEHVIVAHALAKIARFGHQWQGREKVPCWLLRFVLHSTSQSPRPPTSVVVDCLSIIAIDLGCDPSNTTALDERYVRIWLISASLTMNQCATGRSLAHDNPET